MAAGKAIWRIWARNQGLSTAFSLLAGGIISIWYPLKVFGYVNIGIALLIFLWEYPIPLMFYLGPVFSTLYFRSVLYVALSVPGFFQAPTIIGSIFLLCTAGTYLFAAIKGETWTRDLKSKR